MTSLSQQMNMNHYSRQADYAQNLMSMICGEHRLDTSARDTLDFHYDGMRLPNRNMAIGTISYGANVSINISNLKAYSISLPIQGTQALKIRGENYVSDANRGLIVSNNDSQELIIDRHCQKLQVVIPEKSMHMVLADLLDKPVEQPIIFNPEMHLASTQMIEVWWKNVQNFLQFNTQNNGFFGLQMLSQDYENFVIKALLLSQEHNYTAALKMQAQQQEPLYIRKVKNFIIEHAHEEICAEDLQRLAGVSKSKLYDEFQQYYGTSPMAYLRKYRLQQIYKILSHANVNSKLSISKLAYDWGFTHLSRFSQDYKEEFGEKPSETKLKNRQ